MAAEAQYQDVDLVDVRQAYQAALQDREAQFDKQPSAFGRVEEDNLVKWQLELDNILERIDHLLRGHKLAWQNGELDWIPPEDNNEKIFNDYGVNEILRILSLYLNRNTILSNYTEDQVELKVYDFGNEVADLILNRYEDMGLETLKKMVIYPMIIRELVDVVHSAYLRALKGGERESLREARQVTQNQPIIPINLPQKERGLLNPFRYISGKYK